MIFLEWDRTVTRVAQGIALLAIVLSWGASGARAQNADGTPTDLNEGKSPAQLFAADCSVCHNRPQGLAKDRGARGLSSFLRQHYTSSAQAADGLAAFLISAGPGAAQPAQASPTPARRGFFGQTGPEPAPASTTRRGSEPSGPSVDSPAAGNARRGREASTDPAEAARPPRRVPDAAGRPDAGQTPRRPASAEVRPAQPAAAPAAPAAPKRDEIPD